MSRDSPSEVQIFIESTTISNISYLFNNKQIQTVFRFQLIGNILQQPGQLNVILLVHKPTKQRQVVQPHWYWSSISLGSILGRVGKTLNDAEAQHIKGEVIHVFHWVHYGSNQVVSNLMVFQNKAWIGNTKFN